MTVKITMTGIGGAPRFPVPGNSYQAVLNATGTNAPIPTIISKSMGEIAWRHDSTGQYIGELKNAFGTKSLQYAQGQGNSFITIDRINQDQISLAHNTYDGTPIDGLTDVSITIIALK